MNILFLSNWERTETWIAAGAELERRGHRVHFSVTRDAHVKLVQAAGFSENRILWLNRKGAKEADISAALIGLEALEKLGSAQISEFILMDRFLRTERQDWALRYTAYVFGALQAFIETNQIDLAIGQPDNIPDLLAGLILKQRGGRYAAPFEFRMPTHRFMLWDSAIEARPHITGAPSPANVSEQELQEARDLRARVTRGTKMRQVEKQSTAPTLGRHFLRQILRGLLYRALIVSRHDVYMYTPRSVLTDLKYHMTAINHWQLKRRWHRIFEQPCPGEAFVFYALNYTPEHTVDVEAPAFVSTYETVRNIARSLPLGVKLYVKEHPTAIGIRGPAELDRLKRLPGVRLIDPGYDSHALITSALLTVSLSGTVSLEAAMYGCQTAILSGVFIENFSTCRKIDAPWQVGTLLSKAPLPHDPEADLHYLAWLISNSHPGTVIEPLVDPTSLAPENIARIANAIERVIQSSS